MVEVVTFGCRIISYESEVLKEKLARLNASAGRPSANSAAKTRTPG